VVEQIRQRFAGERIDNRLVSLFDPDARPIRKGKKSNPNQFGSMVQYTELSAHTRRGARGLLLPPTLGVGSVHEDVLLPETVAELIDLDLRPQEAVFDRGFSTKATLAIMAPLGSKVFIAGSPKNSGSRRTQRRVASHRVGCEGRISHIKREYDADRSRLKGATGALIWAAWVGLAYDLDTVARLPVKRPEIL
jgi:IS5 family transposase